MPLIDLAGTWACSYTGWSHVAPLVDPLDDETWDQYANRLANNLPPMIGGVRCVPKRSWFSWGRTEKTYELAEGYFPIAGLLCLTFEHDGGDLTKGTLFGFEQFNRSGLGPRQIPIASGSWITSSRDINTTPPAQIQTGEITTVPTDDRSQFYIRYRFVVRSSDEFDWIIHSTRLPTDPDTADTDPLSSLENDPAVSPGVPTPPYKARLGQGTFRRVQTL